MPVFLQQNPRKSCTGSDTCISIGLVNNMPDEALKATERQFVSLLNAASAQTKIELSLYTMPGIPRNATSLQHINETYANIEDLWNQQIDALIVTGREPSVAHFVDEPYWQSFTHLVDWSKENSHATVWSCLAAHAAVFHLDGVPRVRRDDKLFGVFDCVPVADHPLTAGLLSPYKIPHSRWNGLSGEDLTDSGYRLLTQSTDAGVDTFMQPGKHLRLFFQGHPEYASDTLLREYRRDIARYSRGETAKYPSQPQHYFDYETQKSLDKIENEAILACNADFTREISSVLARTSVQYSWQSSALGIYKNWLQYTLAQKTITPLQNKPMRSHLFSNWQPLEHHSGESFTSPPTNPRSPLYRNTK